ncbi:MAG: hypothetical protein AB7E48_06710 [Deferribacterales bacterium]
MRLKENKVIVFLRLPETKRFFNTLLLTILLGYFPLIMFVFDLYFMFTSTGIMFVFSSVAALSIVYFFYRFQFNIFKDTILLFKAARITWKIRNILDVNAHDTVESLLWLKDHLHKHGADDLFKIIEEKYNRRLEELNKEAQKRRE